MEPPPKPPLIRASELAQYGFCHRAWWLDRVRGVPRRQTALLERGRRHHRRHSRLVKRGYLWRWVGWLLLAGGLLLVVIWAGYWL